MVVNHIFDPKKGARNLLSEAMHVESGQKLVVVTEDIAKGVYDGLAPICIAEEARKMGASVDVISVPADACAQNLPDNLITALNHSDKVLFHSGVGDRLRFSNISGRASVTVSYALDIGMLGSVGCTQSHNLMRQIQKAYESKTDQAKKWRITCPLGTDISGEQNLDEIESGEAANFTVTRFPVCAPRPIDCSTANGVVAVARWLISTSNRLYEDDVVMLDEPVMVSIKDGKISGVDAPDEIKDKFLRHYERVGNIFSIEDPLKVNSWHAGMNPGVSYPFQASNDPDRWGKTTFANPRHLHFHTCGDEDPGEISWALIDTSVYFDDELYWHHGNFVFLNHPECKAVLSKHNMTPSTLAICTDIGVD